MKSDWYELETSEAYVARQGETEAQIAEELEAQRLDYSPHLQATQPIDGILSWEIIEYSTWKAFDLGECSAQEAGEISAIAKRKRDECLEGPPVKA